VPMKRRPSERAAGVAGVPRVRPDGGLASFMQLASRRIGAFSL